MDTPTPPEDAPLYIIDGLQKQDPATLTALSSYVEQLADEKHAEMEAKLEEREVEFDDSPDEWGQDDWEAETANTEAPAKACVTTKTIDGRDYYYYQWRDGSQIKSEYIAPVNPSD
jgi:hypothetical protein